MLRTYLSRRPVLVGILRLRKRGGFVARRVG
jgi:hypothetical protein